MKTKTVVIAGLIMCATVLQAQSGDTRSADGNGQFSTAPAAVSKEHETKATGNRPLPARLAEEQIRQWKYGGQIAYSSPRNGGNNSAQPIRVINIEALQSKPNIAIPDRSEIRKHMLRERRFRPDEYAWFDPRMALSSWANFWMNGTDAPPVVLVLIRF